jgi:four helix bundle protein
MKSFKELEVWRKAVKLAALLYKRTEKFPTSENYVLIPQIRKAAVSVPANIAEGWGRGSTKEYVQFLLIARGSLMELLSHFAIAHELEYLNEAELSTIEAGIDTVGRMLNGLISSLRLKRRPGKP